MRKTTIRLVLATFVALAASMAAQAELVDLATAPGGSGTINGAIFEWTAEQPTGTGVIDSFVRIQALGNDTTEQGYNTTENNVFDTGNTDTFNHELLAADVPVVNIGGVDYRQFLLDINEPQGQPGDELLTLDDLQLFLSNTPNQSVETFTGGVLDLADSSLIYSFDADDSVELNAALNSGSGSGDMFFYVPDSLFVNGFQYVYLYSSFGNPNQSTGGFEEWAVLGEDDDEPGEIIPEPMSLSLMGLGLAAMAVHRLRSRR